MRTSNFLIATQKETPADAEVISHQLMLRAGLIRKLASGLYTWLPLGLRVLRKVEGIIRQEMDNAGAQELSMPVMPSAMASIGIKPSQPLPRRLQNGLIWVTARLKSALRPH